MGRQENLDPHRSVELTALTGTSQVQRPRTSTAGWDAVVDIVAIHGLGDHPFPTWTTAPPNIHWLSDYLPRKLPQARILTFGYNPQSLWSTESSGSVERAVHCFLEELARVRRDTKTLDRSIIFLGHSLGGPVAMRAFLFSLYSILGTRDGLSPLIDIQTSARGIALFESLELGNSHIAANIRRDVSSLELSSVDQQARPLTLVNSSYKLPLTLFVNQKASQESDIQSYLKLFLTQISTQCIPVDLTEQAFPFTDVARLRVIGEIQKFMVNSIPTIACDGNEHIARLIHWLSPEEDRTFYSALPAVKGSFHWALEHKSLVSWLNSDQEGILWICGKPGSGKSALMRYLIDGFHDHTIDSWRPTITPYIFWQPFQPLRREKGKAQQAFLRALLCQILAQMPKASLDGLCLQNPTSPCLEDLWEFDPHEFQACLRTLLYAITNVTRVCLFVDALDECGDDAQEILSYLEQLSVRPDLLQRLRVFVSSRSAPAETQEFVMNTIWVDQENASDIAAFTEAQLSALITPQNSRKQSDMLACGKTDEVLKQIVETITQRAQGIFLWVHLAIRTLEAEFLSLAYPSLWFLQEAASRLPTEINVLYDGLIKGISTSHQVMAQKVLTWVSCTVRPLSTDELYTALQLTHQTRDAEFVGYKDLDLVSWVIPMCGGLVELVSTPFSQSRYVQFIHSSAKEFCVGPGAQLLSPKAKSSEDAVARAHDSISHVCLDYLLQAQCRPKGLVKYDIPFLNYSLSNWAYHLHASIRHKSPPQSYLLDAFMFSHRSSKLGKVCYFTPARNSSTSHTSMLHVLSQYGIINAVRACLKGSYTELQQLEDSCVCRRTSLQLAIRGEHTGVVKLLLDHGANLNSRDQFGSTPLHAAVISGYESMVELLLERGADFTCTDAKGITPLLCATKKGHVQITQLLLKWAADLNISNSCRGSLISLAAGRGHQSILEVFFKRWSISHTSSWSSGTILGVTLVVAAAAGHAKVVRWLLQSNLFDTLEDNIIQQGFIASIVRGHIDIVKIFFEFGCHPDIHDNQHGQSALALAAAGGHSLVVDYLLQHGADANISDRQTGNTPLVYAVGGGFLAIVRLLLAKGARIDLVGRSSLFAKASWRTRILTALTLECARDKPGVVTTFGLGQGSSEGSVWGSADENHGARKGSGPDRKRARGEEKSGQDGPNDGDDARGNKRHCKNKTGSSLSNEREWACPFQKAFPSEHECGALRDVSRIKEHIYRKHRVSLCPHCWCQQKDEAAIIPHIVARKCEYTLRSNHSVGICTTQYNELKSRKGLNIMTEVAKWERVFKIICRPDQANNIPSPYYTKSVTLEDSIQLVRNSQSLQESLGSCLRPGVTFEHIVEMLHNEANKSQDRQVEHQILSELPIISAQDEDANPNNNCNNNGAPSSSSNIHLGSFGMTDDSLTNNSLSAMPFSYQVPNYAESLAHYPEAHTNSDSGFVTAPSNSEFVPTQSDPGLGTTVNPTTPFFHNRPQLSSGVANYQTLPPFASARAYSGFGFSQDNNIGMNFGPDDTLNLDSNLEESVHVGQNVLWQGSNDQPNCQRDSADQNYSQLGFNGRKNRDPDDGE